jgi:arsenite methyltransferase
MIESEIEATMSQKESTSTAGHELAAGDWLDLHFEASRVQYEFMIRAAGIQPGWSVLDAGCGGGSFLPLINELVGDTGRISAFDLAPENVTLVQKRIAAGQFSCPVEARQGNLLALPYADNSFDGAWSANVSQYLTDDEFVTMLCELRRVTRPGGLVAIKEYDSSLQFWGPMDPFLWSHFFDKCCQLKDRPEFRQAWGAMRTINLPIWLRKAGLTDIHFQTVVGNWQHPLRPFEKQFFLLLSDFWSSGAEKCALPEEEWQQWKRLVRDVDGPDHLLKHPDFFARESHGLAIGVVPV